MRHDQDSDLHNGLSTSLMADTLTSRPIARETLSAMASAIATERCRPPVQPTPIVT